MGLTTSFEFNEEGNEVVVKPVGDLDIFSSADFKKSVVRALDEYEKVDLLIDGTSLEYVDSTGLGALMFLVHEVEAKEGKVAIDNIQKNILKLLKITQMDQFVEVRGEL